MMAHYIVRARLKPELAEDLRKQLEVGAFKKIRPFGRGMSDALERARRDTETDEVVWEEQCFCNPPLAMEREAVLDRYFDDIETEEVSKGEGWKRLDKYPAQWDPGIEGREGT